MYTTGRLPRQHSLDLWRSSSARFYATPQGKPRASTVLSTRQNSLLAISDSNQHLRKKDGKKVSRKEVGDCKDWFRGARWVREALPGQCGDKKLELAGRRIAPLAASSWLHRGLDAAGLAPATNAPARSLPNRKNFAENNSEWQHSPQAQSRQKKPRSRSNSCAIDLRDLSAAASQIYGTNTGNEP